MVDIAVTGEMNDQQRRLMVERQNALAANALMKCGGFDWFKAQCERKAQILEREVLDMGKKVDPRDEDRFRGAAEAYRAMPAMIQNAVTRFNNKAAKVNAQAASQRGESQP